MSKEGGGTTATYLAAKKLLHRKSSVCESMVIVNELVLVLPSFWMLLANLLPHMIQNLPEVILVNYIACRNKFLLNNVLTVERDHQITNTLLMFDLTCLTFFRL